MGRTRTASAVARKWAVDELARNIHRINITLDGVGDEQWVLLQSDVHWDSKHCDRDMLEAHWHEARDRDAPILDNGDFFDCMGGKWDRRTNKADLRPEHQQADYFDALITTSAAALKPYQDLLTVRGQGNHETAILKHHETNLTDRLVDRLRTQGAPHVRLGGYSGYVVFAVHYQQTRRKPFKLFYHHGYGGGGAVTRGVITTNRQAVFLADADLVWTGHVHDAYDVRIARVRLNADCNAVEHTEQTHLRTPGYKQEYADGYGGWHIERGGPPKPLGSKWLRFRHQHNQRRATAASASPAIVFDVIEAK